MPRMRDAMRAGEKSSRSSGFSPTPTKRIGTFVTARTESAAPPRESPSSLVSTTPVSGRTRANSCALLHRVLAGHGVGDVEDLVGRDRLGQPTGSRPSAPRRRAAVPRCRRARRRGRARARRAATAAPARPRSRPAPERAPGSRPGDPPVRAARPPRRAGGRRRPGAGSVRVRRAGVASLPAVVVLPEPCSPQSRITAGEPSTRSSRASSPPSVAASSSRTTAITCCAGERLSSTFSPSAFASTRASSSLTTRKWTSASSRASRICFSAAARSSRVIRASPRRRRKTSWSFSERPSNMRRKSLSSYPLPPDGTTREDRGDVGAVDGRRRRPDAARQGGSRRAAAQHVARRPGVAPADDPARAGDRGRARQAGAGAARPDGPALPARRAARGPRTLRKAERITLGEVAGAVDLPVDDPEFLRHLAGRRAGADRQRPDRARGRRQARAQGHGARAVRRHRSRRARGSTCRTRSIPFTISAKDRADIAFAVAEGPTSSAASYIGRGRDVEALRAVIAARRRRDPDRRQARARRGGRRTSTRSSRPPTR